MPTVEQFLTWCLYGGITGLVYLIYALSSFTIKHIIQYFKSFLEELQNLRKEMAELNKKITTIISDQGWMGKSIEKHDGLFKEVFDRLNDIDVKIASKGKSIGH